MINKKTFGSFIREKRLEQGLTQKELAEKLILSESAISKWESGKSYPDITLVPEICKVLDVSEHELIRGANDTEFREMKKQATLYRKVSETFFWGFTGSYILALIICFICDLAINKGLTFSPIVFGSLLVAFTFIPTATRFTNHHKLAVFTVSTFTSISLLLGICCFIYEQNWWGIATMGTLLGYIVLFLPYLLKRYAIRKYNVALYFFMTYSSLFILLFVIGVTNGYDMKSGYVITLFTMIPFAIISIMHMTSINGWFKASVDTFFMTISLYSLQYILTLTLGENDNSSYKVNFSDWPNHVNGNVFLLTLITGIILSIAFFIVGIKKKHRR